jgi:hypothetical protein
MCQHNSPARNSVVVRSVNCMMLLLCSMILMAGVLQVLPFSGGLVSVVTAVSTIDSTTVRTRLERRRRLPRSSSRTDDNDDTSTPDATFRCTIRGTTDTPMYPWCPQGAENDNDDDEEDAELDDEEDSELDDDYAGISGDDQIDYDGTKDCPSIATGTASTTASDYSMMTYQIDLALEIDGDVAETLARLEDFLQEYIATDLAGCNDAKDRGVEIQNVVFDVVEDTDSGMCIDSVGSPLTYRRF